MKLTIHFYLVRLLTDPHPNAIDKELKTEMTKTATHGMGMGIKLETAMGIGQEHQSHNGKCNDY